MVKKYFSGFTLVELIIVITIIGMLAAIIIMFLPGQISKGNDAKRKADINRIKIAVEEYEKDHNCYPQSVECITNPTSLQPYLDVIPCDPKTHQSYPYEPGGSTSCPVWWRFYANLENAQDSSITPGLEYGGKPYNYVQSSDNAPPISFPTPSPTQTPGPTGAPSAPPSSGYYGCDINGICQLLSGPNCVPNFHNSTCNGECKDFYGNPINRCQ
jgi:prepilin-type N-terminal cleavage/methylation domain-containing protein